MLKALVVQVVILGMLHEDIPEIYRYLYIFHTNIGLMSSMDIMEVSNYAMT
jgi:hypothetical protein